MNTNCKYKINLASRNEGVFYSDESGTYKFNEILHKKEWKLYLPCICAETNKICDLANDREQLIIQRITNYLESIRWLGIFTRKYSVRVIKNNSHEPS